MALTDPQIKNAKPDPKGPVKLFDGRGLQLWISPKGLKTWRLYVSAKGREIGRTLGHYPGMSIKEARLTADRTRLAVLEEAETAASPLADETFGAVKAQWLDQFERSPVAEKTREKARWLCAQTTPLDPLPLQSIKPPTVLALLKTLEAYGKFETAARLKSVISRIFRYAAAHGIVEHDPTALLRGAIIPPSPKGRAAIVEREDFGRLMRAIAGYKAGRPAIVRDGLMLLALTASRPGELRRAEWREFDLARAEWTIPAGRMKMRQPHRAPISAPALDILRRLAEENGRARPLSSFLLPSPRPGQALSDHAFNGALRSLGFAQDEMSAHGFRSSFSTLANQSGLWAYDAIERQLAHQETSDVRRAYHRADYFDERRRLMEWWGGEIAAMTAPAD
jgi:integrase